LRSKDAIHSELDDIKGIGEKTATDLLKAFKSVSEIKLASLDALIGVVGPAKAKIIYEYFH
jgi:excinuclease ABC subunit C